MLMPLVKYYEALAQRGEIEPRGWSSEKVSYGICLNRDGTVERVVSLKQKPDENAKSKKELPAQMRLPMPVKKTVGICSNFLQENSAYIFGADFSGKPKRAAACREACAGLHREILKDCTDEYSAAIKAFFDKPVENAEQMLADCGCTRQMIDEIMGKGARLLLMPLGKIPTDSREITDAWNAHYSRAKDLKATCLVTGKVDSVAVLHPSIKNIRGAQSSGASLVSFNAPAFESFGKTQGCNAPVGEYAAFAYTTALNRLAADNEHKVFIGDTTVVFWAENAEPVYSDIMYGSLCAGDNGFSDADLMSVMRNLADGSAVQLGDVSVSPDVNFYVLGLSPNASRLSVRFFLQNSFGAFMKNLLAHEKRMETVKPSYEKRERITVWQMANETVNPNSKDKACKPHLAGDILLAVLNGHRYPETLFYGVENRISAEENINWGKASVIKAYLIRNYNREDLTVELNESGTSKAYLLGVLFSNLEDIQERANPGIKATIRDRYFVSAGSTPALVFPLIIDLAQSHLKKLGRDKGGQMVYLQKQLTETMSKLGGSFPARLSLEEKGMFQLGYYQQVQKKYEKKNKEDKDNG